MGAIWKEALLRAAGKMSRKRIKGNKARVVLNGDNVVMGRAKRGIYEGRHIQFGNQISVDGGNKSRRNWKPNVKRKRLYSFALDQFIRVHVTTHALRSIDLAGGIDEYLLKLPDNKMENDLCLYWKRQIQTVNRYLYKIRSGDIPPELHENLLEDYNTRLHGRKWEFPVLGNKVDEESRDVAPEVLSLIDDNEGAEAAVQAAGAPAQGAWTKRAPSLKDAQTKSTSSKKKIKARPKRIVFSKAQVLKNQKKAARLENYKKLKATKA